MKNLNSYSSSKNNTQQATQHDNSRTWGSGFIKGSDITADVIQKVLLYVSWSETFIWTCSQKVSLG